MAVVPVADFVLTKSRKKHKIKKGFCEILLDDWICLRKGEVVSAYL